MANGLELLGTGRNTRLDATLKTDVQEMISLSIKSNVITARERKHVTALELWANGYVITMF